MKVGGYADLARRVKAAWVSLRKERGAMGVVRALEGYSHRWRLNTFLTWRLSDSHDCERSYQRLQGLLVRLTSENQTLQDEIRGKPSINNYITGHSFDSAVPQTVKAPLSFTRDPSGSCHERLYSNAKEKKDVQTLFARVKVERETVGCTFKPDTASSTLSFANSLNCSAFYPSRNSTPCKSPEGGSSAPGPPQLSPFERLYQQDREKRNSQRLREAERHEKETEKCTFQPKVLRSRTPEPRGPRYEQLHDVSDSQHYAKILQKRRTQELRQSEMELQGLSFVPALSSYKPKVKKETGEVGAVGKERGALRLKPRGKHSSMDLSSSSSQVA